MADWSRRTVWLLFVLLLVLSLLSSPALAHEGHADHEHEEDDDLPIWPFFVVFGTISAGGSLLASRLLDVPRGFTVGLAAGGIAIAVGAAFVWLV